MRSGCLGVGGGGRAPKPSFGVSPSCFPPGSEPPSLYYWTVSLKNRSGGDVEAGRGMWRGWRDERDDENKRRKRKWGSIVLNKSQSQMEMFEQETPSLILKPSAECQTASCDWLDEATCSV